MKIYINTDSQTVEINGELFLSGEWKHVPDDFGIERDEAGEVVTDQISSYPQLKEASVLLAEKTKAALEAAGLGHMAQGIKEADEANERPVTDVAADVLKYAPNIIEGAENED